MTHTYWLSLGSNIGVRLSYLIAGIDALGRIGTVESESPVYETEPWGEVDQPKFLNMVAKLVSDLEPAQLLSRIKSIESAAGRRQTPERWGPRTLDIDILLCDGLCVSTPELCIPHAHMTEREFVMAPLADVAPDVVIPGTGRTCGGVWDDWKRTRPVTAKICVDARKDGV